MNNYETEFKILKTLTKKKINRSIPHLKGGIKQIIRHSVTNNNAIPLIGFWGFGPKSKSNWADKATCEFLVKLNEEIKTFYPPGIELTFIFSLEHGLHNQLDIHKMNSYKKDIEKLFKKHKFKSIDLARLWMKYKISSEEISKRHKQKNKKWWQNIPDSKSIEKSAKKRNNGLPAKEAAQKYVIMRILETEMLETEFKGSIFHTYSPSHHSFLLPDMPRLHLYSYKKGRSESPWFIEGDLKK